ncbi:E3 ubiquitin-protein ligase listerin [Marchantia polymorpha subsp. ruderalis]|uniref:E3 ubiquitin-protein ligase listerin n=2 Tax=Marchantia polymorpha TaxID=3197 RepID=A0AAF6BX21_MARPO|nr:hypothetical protein MARPO_0076s0060 [Marchantia polymorpha]BBN16555.1 hypothetical protein Mp_7g07340 [Marchantia polymorpha subsp. ruderalis]|eukprot:PTQ34823.1 hypothetical protein MARPO_0076s0060 [Marchantia polymorpha]
MGRNKGDPARSKARPSSSSFAASLLQTPVASAVGFGGYVGSARVETGPSPDGELLTDVDGEASLHLKRLSKKDSTTKMKALAALTALFKDRPAAELSTLLPSWVFEYKRLVQDSSRQVRESSHIAMTALVNSVGRGIAPHLRSLMGPWWVAQFDPSREVSEAAKCSFQTAFIGQKKRLEALIYCANEIFIHLDENLKSTPQTISDKATPIEEATEKHERVVSCSLLAMAAIIDVLVGSLKTGPGRLDSPVDVDVAAKTRVLVTEAATKLCWNHKYIRDYLKSKSSRIRSAAYQALRAYIQHIPEVFKDSDMESVVPSILGTFSEKDTGCHQPMWDMILLFARNFPQAWGVSSVKKVVFPRLFGYLRHSCYGSELLSYPSLLPFLSLIPPEHVIPSQAFILEFLSSFWRGRPGPQLGSTYWSAHLKALQECLIWAVKNAKRFADAEGSNVSDLQVALIDGVLLKLLWCDYIGTSTSHAVPVTSTPMVTSHEAPVDSTESSQTHLSRTAAEGSGAESLSSKSAITNEDFSKDLCSCIVDIIQSLSEHELLASFWTEFQDICLKIVEEAGRRWQSSRENDRRLLHIAEFFVVLGIKTSKNGTVNRWVLTSAVRPFVCKAFPNIKILGDPESIRLLAKLTSIYGPTIFNELGISSTKELESEVRDQDFKDHERMLQYFKEGIVPWCLDGDDELSEAKAELVLAFIQSPKFQEEWDFVVAHVTGGLGDTEKSVDLKSVGVLSTLLEKVSEIGGVTSRNQGVVGGEKDTLSEWWKSPRIDNAALRVASSDQLSHPACYRLVRSVLGGMRSDARVPSTAFNKATVQIETPGSNCQSVTLIVSDNAAKQILQILLMRILSVLALSDSLWVKSVPSRFVDSQDSELLTFSVDQNRTEEVLELAATAVRVVREGLQCLRSLDRDSTVSGKLVAALFCLRWGCPKLADTPLSGNDSDSEVDSEEDEGSEDGFLLDEEIVQRSPVNILDEVPGPVPDETSGELQQEWIDLMESVRDMRLELSPLFCKSFSPLTRFRVRQILIHCLRDAVFDANFETPHRVAVKVAAWAKEVVTFTCEGPGEVSDALDMLLASGDCWPQWVDVPSLLQIKPGQNLVARKVPHELQDSQTRRHERFASFVDLLCRTLSPREVYLGSSAPPDPEVNQDETKSIIDLELCSQSCRTWLVVELLCTWEWPGGTASQSVIPLLCSLSRTKRESTDFHLLWNVIETLFVGASNACNRDSSSENRSFTGFEDDKKSMDEPFLRALLKLLKGLLEMEDGWSKADTRLLFRQFVTNQDVVTFVSPICDIRILPSVLSVLMPTLRRKPGSVEKIDSSVEEEWHSLLKTAVSEWLLLAMSATPLVACDEYSKYSGVMWIRVAVACFPQNAAGGVSAMASAFAMQVSPEEKALLLSLLQKQFSREAIAAVAGSAAIRRNAPDQGVFDKKRKQVVEGNLAKLVAAAIAYCWLSFGVEEWEFVLGRLRTWMEEAVVDAEEFAENVVHIVKETAESSKMELQNDLAVVGLENLVSEKDIVSTELSSTAVSVFSLLRGLEHLEGAESTDAITHMQTANWKNIEMRALEDVLRLLLAIGLAESAAANSEVGEKARSVIASWRKLQGQLWDNVADVALSASNQAREASIRAVDLWGVGTGAISALYALLFSPQPTMSLQWVAYNFLTSGQVLQMAITCGVVSSGEGDVKGEEDVAGDESQEALTSTVAQIRPELSSVIGASPSAILVQPLTSPLRVRYLLGWSLFLTRLPSLAASSSTRERLVQYVQDSDISATLLDCLFQHIPLDQNVGGPGSRRKHLGAATKTSSAAAAATRAAATGSVAFAVEGLWPVQKEGLVTLAGAIYGLMLLVLPACVRIWFTGLRDKAMASAIEIFTTTYCSPQLLSDEFAQVQASTSRPQGAALDEDEFSIRANRSSREVTAIYKKEEAGMDIVIKMPPCYPLRAVGVECTRRMGIDEHLLRKWILSMASFLRNQNGAVSEAVQMWKRNVDREFEGVEPCPICYSIIHTSNHSLPKLACKTCRNKFHSACLYKWFSTSHQSTCPLCKTPF